MKLSITLSVLLMCVAGVYLAKSVALDFKTVSETPKLLDNLINCICLDQKCTPEGRDIKERLPASLKSGCADCTEEEKANSKEAITFLKENRPKDFECIVNKYDPTGEYKDVYTF